MLMKPLDEKPRSCGMCELTSVECPLCGTKNPHCMKYHAATVPATTICEWRNTVANTVVMQQLTFSNRQLAEHYSLRHMRKKWGTIRGVTTRLTITPDLFGKPRENRARRRKHYSFLPPFP